METPYKDILTSLVDMSKPPKYSEWETDKDFTMQFKCENGQIFKGITQDLSERGKENARQNLLVSILNSI